MQITTTEAQRAQLPQPFRMLSVLKGAIMGTDFIGGPSPCKMAVIINLFKAGTLPYCLYLQWKYDNWGPTMSLYTGLHGAYGMIWLMKEYIAPDRGWQHHITIPTLLTVSLFPLGAYWIAPYLIASGKPSLMKPAQKRACNCHTKSRTGTGTQISATSSTSSSSCGSDCKCGCQLPVPIEASARRRIGCTIAFCVGACMMFGADIQKHFVLKERPGLIKDGMFSIARNANILGECLLYGSFAALAVGRWEPWTVLSTVWGLVFTTQCMEKEQRLARHPGWEEYKQSTAAIIPGVI